MALEATAGSLGLLDSLQLLTSVVSLACNTVLVLGNHRRGARRWATDGILIAMTGCLDCVLNVSIVGLTLVRLLAPSAVHDGSAWCQISFVAGRVIGLSCLNLAMFLSLVRYLVIVRHRDSNPRFWTCAAIATVGFVAAVTLLQVATAKPRLSPSSLYCTIASSDPSFASAALNALFLFACPPLFVIPFCYGHISSHYARLMDVCEADLHVVRVIRSKILGIVVVTLAYWLAVIPGFLLHVATRFFGLVPPPVLDGLAYWLLTSVSLINAVFSILFHNEIKHNVIELLSPKPAASR